MRAALEDGVDALIDGYCSDHAIPRLWRRPLVRFADATSPLFPLLRKVAMAKHCRPDDFLAHPGIVISYFLPFIETVAMDNVHGELASPGWAGSYLETNAMAVVINRHIVEMVKAAGHRGAIPDNIGFDADVLMSRWSQRHVAWIAGHGSFGLNNMLIGERGCCGRYFSVVTDLPVEPDIPVGEEYCLFKRNGGCKICAKRCFSGALSENGFDRNKCYVICLRNEALRKGADVCGKCVVGLPCSHRRPA